MLIALLFYLKALTMKQRQEAVDVSTPPTIHRQDVTIKALEQEASKLKQELKRLNVAKEVLQLQVLQRKLARGSLN